MPYRFIIIDCSKCGVRKIRTAANQPKCPLCGSTPTHIIGSQMVCQSPTSLASYDRSEVYEEQTER